MSEKEMIKYTANIDNRFWEHLLKGLSPGHAYSYAEALASLIQRSYSSVMVMDEQWIDISVSTLAPQLGWYRLKTKKFLDWCVDIGILERKSVKKQTFGRVLCLKIEKHSRHINLPQNDSDQSDRPEAHPPAENSFRQKTASVDS